MKHLLQTTGYDFAAAIDFGLRHPTARSGIRPSTLALLVMLAVLPLPGFTAAAVNFTTGTNSDGIVINESGPAFPYGSMITPQCGVGTVENLTVNVLGLWHPFPSDVGIVLVSADGRKVRLMAGAGGSQSLTNGVNLTFSDAANSRLPQADQIFSGSYRPTDYAPGLSQPAPAAAPYATNLATFIGSAPNGGWKLYVYDSVLFDAGSISSWSLDIEWRGTILELRNPSVLSNGRFRVEVFGPTGLPTVIERSSNLTTWLPVATNFFSTSPGVFIDPSPPDPHRFYRALQP